jgi:glycosyltransferase involved in cell wall biosynthesis
MEFVMHHLANALFGEEHQVTVIAERTAWQGVGVDHDYDLARYGIPTRGVRRLGLAGPEALWAIWRRHRRTPFDIIHSHGVSYAGSRAIRAKRLLNIPVVMTPHGEDIQRVPEIGYGLRLDDRWNRKICRNLRNADAVTAISLSVQKELDCVDPSRVVRIPNGVHVKDYGRRRSRYLRDRLGLGDDTVLILSVGRNHVKKGYDYGIKALALLRDKYGVKNMHYVIVGKQVSEHAALVSQLSLDNTVTLLEEIAPGEVTECYHSADMFFSPSIIEGLSLVSIEALACGLPLLVTDVPGNEDVVHDTGAGVIVRSRDLEHMAQGLNKLVRDADVRENLGRIALEKSEAYDWVAVARRYVEVYQNVLAGRPAAYGLDPA